LASIQTARDTSGHSLAFFFENYSRAYLARMLSSRAIEDG